MAKKKSSPGNESAAKKDSQAIEEEKEPASKEPAPDSSSSSETAEQKKSVLVTGDLVLDYHIYEGRRKHYGDSINPGVTIVCQTGGAALVHDLLQELLEPDPSWESHLAVSLPPTMPDGDAIDTSQHAHAFWRPFPAGAAVEKQFWRVSEAMGFGPSQSKPPCESWIQNSNATSSPDIIVLSEGGMGFRDTCDCWEDLDYEHAEWIVLKTSSPLYQGELWERLSEEYSEKLIVVVSANELRKSSARISKGLSWEESIENLIGDLNGHLEPLRCCRHLLVAFESEGGLCFNFRKSDSDHSVGGVHFVYDPPTIEGEHAHKIKGTAFGFLSCLTAAAVWQLTLDPDNPDLAAALEGGLSAMRDLREKGHGQAGSKPQGFPAKRLAKVIKYPTYCYSKARFPYNSPNPANCPSGPAWSLLKESQSYGSSNYELARLILLYGPIALANFPQLKIGKLLTVDRQEIESLRTLSQTIRQYRDHDSGKKPLSLGVFGPPGSGKSFAVEELAKHLVGEDGWMEFNLSQFNAVDDLIGAFHQIRDRVLKGMLPIAFFDEFDSQKYRWLQYLLAPMQDGKFQEGQLTHPIGKCILIFAGGTSWTMETLGPPPPITGHHESEEYRDFRLAKGPDFKSRLDGYLNVIGPNKRKESLPPGSTSPHAEYVSGHPFIDDALDDHYPIRRALMIRGGLGCRVDQKVDIDEGVVHALLNASRYKHGSRSLNKVLQPLKLALPDPIYRSLLAPRGQLELHTNADEFIKLLGQAARRFVPAAVSLADVQVMAPAIHDTWRLLGRKLGWLDPKEDVAFDQLGKNADLELRKKEENSKKSSIAGAERMPGILALVGLSIEVGHATAQEIQQVRQYIEYHLELLAEGEHDGWMQWHLDRDWRYGKVKDPIKKTHPLLIPYRKLDDENKNKDRTQIRNYPEFAEKAGKRIVFL